MSLQCAVLTPINNPRIGESFDLNQTDNWLTYDVGPWSIVSVQAVAETTWGTAVLTLYRSNDAANPFALETATTMGPGSAMTTAIDSTGFKYLHVKVTTVEGATNRNAKIIVIGKASQ